jgi:hypothetical protein
LIELTNCLWLATATNSTLIIPPFIEDAVAGSALADLSKSYCTIRSVDFDQGSSTVYEIDAETSFYIFKVFEDPPFKHQLPEYDQNIMKEVSNHFIKVYAMIWSAPHIETVTAARYLIENHLGNTLKYTSVHKRSMNGACHSIMKSTSIGDYSSDELPIGSREWSHMPHRNPLCDMSPSFINDTVRMHDRQGNKIFISFDGNGDTSSLIAMGCVMQVTMDIEERFPTVPLKYLDLFIAIHGDFFLLNPRSTFSWQVYVVRCILGLESVPVLRNNDYLISSRKESSELNKTGLVVTWLQIAESAKTMRLSGELTIL